MTMNVVSLRRWLIRSLAFGSILFYGIFLVSSQKQLKHMLDAAFDVSLLLENENDIGGFRHTRYHKHIYIKQREIDIKERDVITSMAMHNKNTSLSTSTAQSNETVRIAFELHDPKTVPLTNKFNLYVKCPLGKVTNGRKKIPTGEFRTGELPPTLKRVANVHDYYGVVRSGRVLDFTVTISTDLKLLLIGDSVMVQLAQAFDEIMGGRGDPPNEEERKLKTRNSMNTKNNNDDSNDDDDGIGVHHPRKIVWEAWRGHDGGTIVAPTRGGGVSATWRMTALLSRSRKGKPPANSDGGGWSDTEINTLSGFSYQLQQHGNHGNSSSATNTTLGNFDVLIFRVMHGWMKIHEITHDRLVEAVELSHELLGASTVVLMTIPFTNNVKTMEEMIKVEKVNDDIRQIARSWHERKNTGVNHVLVLEYGTYYNHIIWSNGIHLGYNVTHPLRATQEVFDTEGPGFVSDRLEEGGSWPPSIPMVCSDLKSLNSNGRKKCNRNYLFSDGMHTCPETLASRYSAGLACLIGCVYNRRKGVDISNSTGINHGQIRACEKECNEQFLSVVPVEEAWVDTNTSLASFSG